MTHEELFDIENHNQAEIHLFRQGMFYRAYERSCVALQTIERYAVLKKHSATTGMDYIYSGFPTTSLYKITAGRGMTQVSDDHIIVAGTPVNDDELEKLKQDTPITASKPKKEPPMSTTPPEELTSLLELIRCFDPKAASANTCKQFLSLIQTQL